jgi:hypothetical protein
LLTRTNGAGADTFVYAGTGRADAAGEYNIVADYTCNGTSCAFNNQFMMVDSTGATYDDAGAETDDGGNADNALGATDTKYLTAFLNAIDMNGATAGTPTLDSVAGFKYVNNGPVRSVSYQCDREPFFVDGNGNGVLDCTTQTVGSVTYSVTAGEDKAFTGSWQYQNWLNDPSLSSSDRTARAALPLYEHRNTYSISDPVAAMKLLSVAFNGWFDGAHSFTATTELNTIQTFALLYMFFEEEGERHLDDMGTTGEENKLFEVQVPQWIGNGSESVQSMNSQFSKLFTHHHTN